MAPKHVAKPNCFVYTLCIKQERGIYMKNNKGITLITVVVIIIIIIIIATVSIVAGNKLIVNSRHLTDSQIVESVKEAIYRRTAEIQMQGTITPKGDSYPGNVDPLIGEGNIQATGWYALDKDALANLGVKDVDSRFLVNYNYNDAISMGDAEYIEKYFVSTYMYKCYQDRKAGLRSSYSGEMLEDKTGEGDTAHIMYMDTTELDKDYFGTGWYLVTPDYVINDLNANYPTADVGDYVLNSYLINYENFKYVKFNPAKFKKI